MVCVTNSGSDSEFPIEEMGIFGIHHVQRTNIGVVDTPAPDRRDWPSIEDFQAPETTLKWRDVQPGMYKILEIFKHSQNKYGPRVVLKLESKNGTTFLSSAPYSLFYATENRKSTNFIFNLGKRLDETGYIFYNFKLFLSTKKQNI